MLNEYEFGYGQISKLDFKRIKSSLVKKMNTRLEFLYEKSISLYESYNHYKKDVPYLKEIIINSLEKEFCLYSDGEFELILNSLIKDNKVSKPLKKDFKKYTLNKNFISDKLITIEFIGDNEIYYNSGEAILQKNKARNSFLFKEFYKLITSIKYSTRTGFYFIELISFQGKECIGEVFGAYSKKNTKASRELDKEYNS